jgi:hypothetical protein
MLSRPKNFILREVTEGDLTVLFEQQQDPTANWMAAFTSKDPVDVERTMNVGRNTLVWKTTKVVLNRRDKRTFAITRIHRSKRPVKSVLRKALRHVLKFPTFYYDTSIDRTIETLSYLTQQRFQHIVASREIDVGGRQFKC